MNGRDQENLNSLESIDDKHEERDRKKKLGRKYIKDARDQNFLLKSIVPKELDRSFKYWWTSGWWGDQGYKPHCVGYSWCHWLADGPITQDSSREKNVAPFDPDHVYHEAQKIDAWAGEDYDGTSVRAGAKVLQREGFIDEYRWAWDVDTAIHALINKGPLIVGTWWYSDMYFPNDKGIITATGSKAGGHAYVVNGINLDKKLVRIKNSWGRNWGKNGFAYVSLDDFEKLITEQGECCMAVEIDRE